MFGALRGCSPRSPIPPLRGLGGWVGVAQARACSGLLSSDVTQAACLDQANPTVPTLGWCVSIAQPLPPTFQCTALEAGSPASHVALARRYFHSARLPEN